MFRELATLMDSFRSTLAPLLWALFALCLVLFVYAVIFTQGIGIFLREHGDGLSEEQVIVSMKYFGSVGASILSLDMSVTGGYDWYCFYEIISHSGTVYA